MQSLHEKWLVQCTTNCLSSAECVWATVELSLGSFDADVIIALFSCLITATSFYYPQTSLIQSTLFNYLCLTEGGGILEERKSRRMEGKEVKWCVGVLAGLNGGDAFTRWPW